MNLAFVTVTPELNVPIPVSLFSGTFSERLEKAVRNGYDGVELMVARPAELDARAIRTEVESHGLQVTAIASGAIAFAEGLTLLAPDAQVSRRAEDRLGQLIEFAEATGAPLVTIGSFRGRLASAGPGARDELHCILKGAAAAARERGVRLVIEPLNRYETDHVLNTGEALALFEELGEDSLGLLLDTFHANIEEASVTECYQKGIAAGKLWHVHIGDSNRLPPGQGHIDFGAIVTTLANAGYQGYLSAELLCLPDPDTAGEATAHYMQGLLKSG